MFTVQDILQIIAYTLMLVTGILRLISQKMYYQSPESRRRFRWLRWLTIILGFCVMILLLLSVISVILSQ